MDIKVISIRKIKNKPRCKITLDTGDFYVLSLDLVVKHKLQKNLLLSEKEFKKICDEQTLIDCKQTAYYYASYKPRTTKQIIDKLKEKGFDNDKIQKTIDFLKEFDLLDDVRFAENFILNTLRRKPSGKFKIEMELRKKGIAKETATAAIEKIFPHDKTIQLARKAAEKKLRLLASKDLSKQKNSLISFLKNRGFDWDTIKIIIAETFTDNDN